jgi:hypothetical protein
MLARLADLLRPRPRVVRLHVAAVPPDVLLQSGLVLRTLGAAVARLDVEAGTLEARLATRRRLYLHAEPEAEGSRVTIDVDGRDRDGVARTLAHELEKGAAS